MARPEGHTLEDEGAKKKWDAWKREEGLSRTEAKRRYILHLIDTMRVYASGTAEARELLTELEFLWDQIKDVDFSDDDHVTPLVYSQSDRFLVGTPWPIQSSVASTHNVRNLEQIYLHLRRSHVGSEARYVPAARPDVAATLEDFRAWQGEVNLIINKISRDYSVRKYSDRNPFARSPRPRDSDLESEVDPREHLKRRLKHVFRVLVRHGWGFLGHLTVTSAVMLFMVWCLKKNVVVRRTVVRSGNQRELVINMVVPDENRWFIRLLLLINGAVGFV